MGFKGKYAQFNFCTLTNTFTIVGLSNYNSPWRFKSVCYLKGFPFAYIFLIEPT